MTWHYRGETDDRRDEYQRAVKTGPRDAWYPSADAVSDDEAMKRKVDSLLGTSLPVDVLEIHEGELPWPRSWTWRVHRRVLMYHPAYSHTKGARKYYDFSDEELFCSLCVKLDIEYEQALEMDAWEVLRVVYDRVRELQVPEQADRSRFERL